jgi:lipoprotein-anchoring transpeptidase ErfK/SrfK
MRSAVFAAAAVLAIGSGAAWTWGLGSSAPRAVAAPVPKAVVRPVQGRVFLTKAQVSQAIAGGTLDRPVASLLAVSAPLHFGDFRWNDQGVPAGPTWIRVDLRSQLISVFRAGQEIGTAIIVYGADNKETPTGHLRILGKARDHRSSLYDAEMPYTLRLTDDGVSIHASSVRWGAATHGCIGVPPGFAQRLFDAAKVGDEVLVVPGNRQRPSQSA